MYYTLPSLNGVAMQRSVAVCIFIVWTASSAAFEPIRYTDRRVTSPAGIAFAEVRTLENNETLLRFGRTTDTSTRVSRALFHTHQAVSDTGTRKATSTSRFEPLSVNVLFTHETKCVDPPRYVFLSDASKTVLLLDAHGVNASIINARSPAFTLRAPDGALIASASIKQLMSVSWRPEAEYNSEFHQWLVFAWFDSKSDCVFVLTDPAFSLSLGEADPQGWRLKKIRMSDGEVRAGEAAELARMLDDPTRASRIGSRLGFAFTELRLPIGDDARAIHTSGSSLERGLARLHSQRSLADKRTELLVCEEVAYRDTPEWDTAYDSMSEDPGVSVMMHCVKQAYTRLRPDCRCRLAIEASLSHGETELHRGILKANKEAAARVLNAEYDVPGNEMLVRLLGSLSEE